MQVETSAPSQKTTTAKDKKRAVAIVAKSLYKELCNQGFDEKQIVSLATALIGEVTTHIQPDPKS